MIKFYYQFNKNKYLITKLFQNDATVNTIVWDKLLLNRLLKDCLPFLNILNKSDYFHNDIALRNIFIDNNKNFIIADYGNLIKKTEYIKSKRVSELVQFFKYSTDYLSNSNTNISTLNKIKEDYPNIKEENINLINKIDLISLYKIISQIKEEKQIVDFQLDSINCIIDEKKT